MSLKEVRAFFFKIIYFIALLLSSGTVPFAPGGGADTATAVARHHFGELLDPNQAAGPHEDGGLDTGRGETPRELYSAGGSPSGFDT